MNAATIIDEVKARKLLDSRGDLTIEVEVTLTGGVGRASAPMGASRGVWEVKPYPKGGVDEAIEKVERLISPELVGLDARDQRLVDAILHEVDGTEDFSNIGGNTAYAVSLAVADAASRAMGIPLFQHISGVIVNRLPYPLGNVIGGGKHVKGKGPDVQEFLVLPIGAENIVDAVLVNILVHRKVAEVLKRKDNHFSGGKGDEGAWATTLNSKKALKVLYDVCEEISSETEVECKPGLDIAASTMWNSEKQRYVYAREKIERDIDEQFDFITSLIEEYDLIYVEDAFHEEDFESFAKLTKKFADRLICGDDLFTTNSNRLKYGIEKNACNTIIVKPNQVGTLTDTWETVKLALKSNYIPVASHRSGESVNAHLAHIAVAFQCPIIKCGVVGGERISKLNELIRIEEYLGDEAEMAEIKVKG